MKLYFIRHTSVDVPEGICYGQSNVPLQSTFEQEAEIIKNKLEGIEFDAVFSSPLSRCRKLAKYCDLGKVQWKDRLKEMHFGDWEMLPWNDIKGEKIDSWYENWINQPASGGESFQMQYDRVSSFIDEIKKEKYTNVAIFTHAGVLNCVRVYMGDTTLENAFDWMPSYGEIICYNV